LFKVASECADENDNFVISSEDYATHGMDK
jgi:hypothetical protein